MSNTFAKDFFLATKTCEGFFSVFEHLYYPKEGWFCYILKGGPGTGKSTLMKKIAEKAEKLHIETELIHCSSDPKSLDAVIFPELKVCVADGTAPHVIEPKYPGVSEKIINLGEFWNEKKLRKNSETLIRLFEENEHFHKKASVYLKALGGIKKSQNQILEKATEPKKLKEFIDKLSKTVFENVKYSKSPNEKLRFADAITPDGRTIFENSANYNAKNTYIIEDKHEIISNQILQGIRREAIKKGMNITSFLAPLFPENQLRAVYLPEISTMFIAKNPKTESDLFKNLKNIKKINTTKFFNTEILKSHRNLLTLYEKVSDELLKKATQNLSSALKNHDKIEEMYISAMDYKKINKTADKLISAILPKN
ncbi:MAG: hypothetical protein Q4D57_02455 [Clostridia bacterium]|nr:hypothetical protein [Clostridia bacterium]